MKILILSTNTKHHTYFINKIAKHNDICGIVYERKVLKKDYVTGPFYDNLADKFEDKFFEDDNTTTENTYELSKDLQKKVVEVHSVNNRHLQKYIESMNPDLIITFGTGIVKPYIFNIPKWGTINIHRGDIHNYRGLDSDLWAIKNEDFDKINVTLHYVDEDLDTGDILLEGNQPLKDVEEIYQLRYYTTKLATTMMLIVLSLFKTRNKKLTGTKQENLGDYYTAMSLDDKHLTEDIFNDYKRYDNE
jgi:methionyl-tRNA formyltransferase